MVYKQLQRFLETDNICENFQSAILRVFSDILLTVDSGSSSVFVLLDFSAAFDNMDHNILLSWDMLELMVQLSPGSGHISLFIWTSLLNLHFAVLQR